MRKGICVRSSDLEEYGVAPEIVPQRGELVVLPFTERPRR
jgi:hypothetical protein